MPKRPRRPPSGPLLTREQLAVAYGVDERTVRRWIQASCPVARRGKRGHAAPLFDAAAVKAWTERNADSAQALTHALVAKLDAQSRREARVLGRLLSEHIPLEDFDHAQRACALAVRGRVLRIPGDLTKEIMAVQQLGAPAVAEAIRAHVHGVLSELAGETAGASTTAEEPPGPTAAVVKRSKTLREARAQFADLQAQVIDVRDRIVAGAEELARRRRR